MWNIIHTLFLSLPFICLYNDQCKTIVWRWILTIVTVTKNDVGSKSFILLGTFISSIHYCVLWYAYMFMIDLLLDSTTSRSLAMSKQTYLHNKSSIIFHQSDRKIEGKALYRWIMQSCISIASHPGACMYIFRDAPTWCPRVDSQRVKPVVVYFFCTHITCRYE